jgi:hypothetical protein
MTAPSHPAVVARRARISRIRRTVAVTSVAIFIVLFAGLYVQLAAGRDPALGSKAAVTTGSNNTGSTSSGNDDGWFGEDDGGQSSQQYSPPASVTTSQS